ncbi:MAG: hypothetical protein HC807_06500, partial [Gammaproteobacteria bacterium]|nr:hypothetical protein [Gammaproteobacteria bacterium]
QRYADTAGFLSGVPLGRADRDLVARCVARDDVELTGLAGAAFELLASESGFAGLVEASGRTIESFAAQMTSDEGHAALSDSFFLHLISRTVIPDPRAERLLTAFRRAALERWADEFGDVEAKRWLAPLAALALQCFLNEYAFVQEAAEGALLARLAARTGDTKATAETGAALALLGCYWPLRDDELAGRPGADIVARLDDPGFTRLVRRQVSERAEELRIAAALPAITPVADATSRASRRNTRRIRIRGGAHCPA